MLPPTQGKGLGVDAFHCMACNACMSLELFNRHACKEQSLEGTCPVCSDRLFESKHPIKVWAGVAAGASARGALPNVFLLAQLACGMQGEAPVGPAAHAVQPGLWHTVRTPPLPQSPI